MCHRAVRTEWRHLGNGPDATTQASGPFAVRIKCSAPTLLHRRVPSSTCQPKVAASAVGGVAGLRTANGPVQAPKIQVQTGVSTGPKSAQGAEHSHEHSVDSDHKVAPGPFAVRIRMSTWCIGPLVQRSSDQVLTHHQCAEHSTSGRVQQSCTKYFRAATRIYLYLSMGRGRSVAQ